MGLHEYHDELELARVDNASHGDLKFDEEVDSIDGLYGELVLSEHARVVLHALDGDPHVHHDDSGEPRGGPQDGPLAFHDESRVSHGGLNASRGDLHVIHGGLPASHDEPSVIHGGPNEPRGELHVSDGDPPACRGESCVSHGGLHVPRVDQHVSHGETSTFRGVPHVNHDGLNVTHGDLTNHEDVVVIHDLLFHDVRGAQFHDEALHQMGPQTLVDSVHQVHALDDVRQSILYHVHQYPTV